MSAGSGRAVLVSQRIVRDGEEIRDALDVRWTSFLAAAGLVPVPVSSGANLDDFLRAVPDVVGLLLTGGNDLAVVSDDPLSRRRDDLELRLCLRFAGRPILGVCRGAQFLAWRLGFAIEPIDGHTATRHHVTVADDSRWLSAYAGLEVASFHAFAPRGQARDVRVAARSDDAAGTIEAIEHAIDPLLGILWHPEREAPVRAVDADLFRRFFG
ncbi:MAG: gamma-glutamyl-gamma-aminobutyrate hydrolase family protein [Myxococcota bacterium]